MSFKAIVLFALFAAAASDAKPASSDLQSSQSIGLGYAGLYGSHLGLGYPGVYGSGLGLGLGGIYGANLGLVPGVRSAFGRSLGLGLGGVYAGVHPYGYRNIYSPLHGVNPLAPLGLNPLALGLEGGLVL